MSGLVGNHGAAEVILAARAGQFDLLLALAKAGFVLGARLVHAVMAAHARLVFRAVLIGGQDRAAAGVAQQVRADLQAVAHADPPVEYKALALPGTLIGWHLFEVFEDAALEVEHILDPLAEQVVRGLLAADAAGAEHRHLLVVEAVLVLLPPRWKLAKAAGGRINGTVEGADGHFVIVAGVDDGHILASDQVVPIGGVHIVAHASRRIDIGLAHGHDLALEPHLHLTEGGRVAGAFLPLQIGATGQGADVGQHRVDACAWSGYGAVDPFWGQQQRALDACIAAQLGQRSLYRGGIIEAREVVEGGDGVHGREIGEGRALAQGGGRVSQGSYAKQEAHMTRALIVIDVQNDFCPGGALAVPEGDQIVAGINALMAEFDAVVLTQDWHPAGHSSFASSHEGKGPYDMVEMPYGPQVLWPDHCVQGTDGANFHADLNADRADMIVRKGYRPAIDSYSAFFENDQKTPTGLEGYLRTRGITDLTMVGLATDFCVNFSAVDAAKLGFKVDVRMDLCRAIDLDGSLAAAEAGMSGAGVKLA